MTPDVIVVGGGIGGLSSAVALTRKGLKVRVLEQAQELGEVGAGIQLAPNCTRILDDLGLLDDAIEVGVLPTRMVMRDAVDGSELTHLDLEDLRRTYGAPYLVIHRSDLHSLLRDACTAAGVELLTGSRVVDYRTSAADASVILQDGREMRTALVVAADGLHSVARGMLVDDEPVSSSYVAYRGTVPGTEAPGRAIDLSEVVVYVGPRCHFVHYGLRGGRELNQVAVFESARAVAGEQGWGTPDELEAAFERTTASIRQGIPTMWRDRWWPMYDRNPISRWVHGRIALLGDAAHPPLQYLAQGAVMAIEDGWVLAEHAARSTGTDCVDWTAALTAYEAVRTEHCRRVVETAREWGRLWHLDGPARTTRNELLKARNPLDYTFIDWLYGPTALTPDQVPPMYPRVELNEAGRRGATI